MCEKHDNSEKIFAYYAQMNLLNQVTLRTLKLFIAVYEARSLSAVARQEGVSPSLVSRAIQQLEDATGQPLFYRNTRSLAPTEQGKIFFRYTLEIEKSLMEMQQHLQDFDGEPGGILRINAPVQFGQHHVAPFLAEFSELFPDVQVELTLTDAFIDPHAGDADVIIRIGALPDSSLRARKICEQRYFLAASPAYLKNNTALTSPADLKQHRCLVYKGFSGTNPWFFHEPDSGWTQQQFVPLMTSNNAEALLTAAREGMGLVLFPDWLVGESVREGKLIPVLDAFKPAIRKSPQDIHFVYPKSQHTPVSVRHFIDYMLSIYGDTPYWEID